MASKAYVPFAFRDGTRGRSGLAYFCVASGSGDKPNSKTLLSARPTRLISRLHLLLFESRMSNALRP